MAKKLCITLALAVLLFAVSGTALAQEAATGSSAAIERMLDQYVRQMEENGPPEPGPQLKAVPRADKAEATVIGVVVLVDSTNFLSDGTPFRIVAVKANKPFTQNVFVVCLGSAFNTSCGHLGLGKRVSFTSDILVVDEGDSAGLALFVAKKLQT
jgi:hypothetical protein